MALFPVARAAAAAKAATADELLASAPERIEKHRKGDITVLVLDRGEVAAGAALEVAQTGHEFLFGCNAYGLSVADKSPAQRAYQERFAALFNYATLPFYWGFYEGKRGERQTEALKAMARWCADHGVRSKGHPLVWHEVVPDWVPRDVPALVSALRERVRSIVSGFAGSIDTWDVINESTVSAGVDNQVGRWVKRGGPVKAAGEALSWARAANPRATLILNDFNVSPAYEEQIQGLIKARLAPSAVGIQSHMHGGVWPLERVWEVCETYGRFGIPVHFTETTVLSGRTKSDDWQPEGGNWPSTPAGERRQAAYVENFYRLLFSHPSAAAITWWDFSDRGAWQGAPAGFLRQDMSPKPVYRRLLKMIKQEWWTHVSGKTNRDGEMRCRGFYGSYRITATARDGRRAVKDVRLFKGDRRRVTLRLPPA
jgi:GH35 family endo-1,4-beta-xylanase